MPQVRTAFTEKEKRAITHVFTFWNVSDEAEPLDTAFADMSLQEIILACEGGANLRLKLPSSLKKRLRAKKLISF